jgi:PKD repeat protein
MLVVGLAGAVPATPAQLAAPDRISLESVPVSSPGDVARLERLGFDVTHDVSATDAVVAFYSDAERERLAAAGFESDVLIPDLAAKSRADRRAEDVSVAASTLPSQRDTYRVYDDYVNEINAIATENPEIARKITIGQSIEGRPVTGLEISAEVNREDDGKPVYLNLGEHHAREWPSGEFPMEFAIDLVNGYPTDPDIEALLDNTRVVIVPIVNPDGFIASRGSAPSAGGAPVVVGGFNEFRRKNCRPAPGDAADAALPCSVRPNSGVDLNRNYGYYWGGPGASASPTSESYRGTAPFSEPESQAVHELSSRIHPTVVISNHTFTETGWWLRQPGFQASFFPQAAPGYSPGCGPLPDLCSITPDEPAMKALGDAMEGATGWPSDLGWELGDITGATEDWNYFAQGAYGYTPEARGLDFHSLYADQVVEEYEGDAMHPGQGVREAFLIAGQYAMDPDHHGIISGPAPPGATLHLRKSFTSPRHPNQGAAPGTPEELHTTLEVPADGQFTWHVAPSSRPLESPETWSMTCVRAGETEEAPAVAVSVGRGENEVVDWETGSACGDPPIEPNLPPLAGFDVTPPAPVAGEEINFISTSTDPDGAIDTTEWDLDGDATEDFADATGLVASATFPNGGTYPIRVRVTDDDGEEDVETQQVVVAPAPPPNQPPTANFTFSPNAPGASQDVQFNSTSTDADGALETYLWDFDGDGQFDDGAGSQVTRAFLSVGSYPVSLQVTDDDGASAQVTRSVPVGQPSGSGGDQSPARPRCRGRTATILGTGAAELLRGTRGADVIVALGGDDRVRARGGDDLVCGGNGRDGLSGGRGDDTLRGGRGADSLRGGRGEDDCGGGRGRDLLDSCS